MTISGNTFQPSDFSYSAKHKNNQVKYESAQNGSSHVTDLVHTNTGSTAKKIAVIGLGAATVAGVGVTAKNAIDSGVLQASKKSSHFSSTAKQLAGLAGGVTLLGAATKLSQNNSPAHTFAQKAVHNVSKQAVSHSEAGLVAASVVALPLAGYSGYKIGQYALFSAFSGALELARRSSKWIAAQGGEAAGGDFSAKVKGFIKGVYKDNTFVFMQPKWLIGERSL